MEVDLANPDFTALAAAYGIPSHLVTGPDGKFTSLLPVGDYQAAVTAFGYSRARDASAAGGRFTLLLSGSEREREMSRALSETSLRAANTSASG